MSQSIATGALGSKRGREGVDAPRWQALETLGAGLPPALTDYFANLDAWRPQEAADCHSVDTINARPAPGESEGMARIVRRGRDELAAFFKERGTRPVHHHLNHWAVNDKWSFVEGVVFDDAEIPLMSFLSSAVVEGGLVKRYVAARDDVPPARYALCGHGQATPDPIVEFLRAAISGDGESAARLLTPGAAVDLTDPSAPTDRPGRRVAASGADGVARLLTGKRGETELSVVAWAASGAELYLEAHARRPDADDLSLLVSATVAGGLIARLTAHSFPAVPLEE